LLEEGFMGSAKSRIASGLCLAAALFVVGTWSSGQALRPANCQGAVRLIASQPARPAPRADANIQLRDSVSFRLPETLRATDGSTAKAVALLRFVTTGKRPMACIYGPPRHGSEVRYGLAFCIPSAHAGDTFEAREFHLRVQSADRSRGVEVRASLGEVPQCGLVTEIPSTVDPRKDPAVRGAPFDPSIIRPIGDIPEQREEAYTGATKWAQPVKAALGPGRSQAVTVNITEPSVVLAKADWTGGTGPLDLTVSRGDVLTEANLPIGPNEGTASARRLVVAAGPVTVTLANRSNVVVNTKFVVGSLPLSAARAR
jgi:hypothetical protein